MLDVNELGYAKSRFMLSLIDEETINYHLFK